MDNTVRTLNPSDSTSRMEEAHVQAVDGRTVLVHSTWGIEPSVRAVSCLVAPEVGDLVLVVRSNHARLYVLSVLERSAQASDTTTLAFEGSLNVTSPGDVTITSKSAHLVNDSLKTTSDRLSVVSREISGNSDTATLHTGSTRLVSKAIDIVGERLSQHIKTLISRVRGHEIRHSGSLSVQVDGPFTQQTDQSVVQARKDYCLNAERIHMG